MLEINDRSYRKLIFRATLLFVLMPFCGVVGCPTGQVQRVTGSSESKSALGNAVFSVSFNGKNYFPLGWYTNLDTSNLGPIRAAGMNTVLPYIGQKTDEEIGIFLDVAKRESLNVVVEISRDAVLAINKGKDAFEPILARVRALMIKPNLLGWYLIDEPHLQGGGIPPSVCKVIFDSIKQADPVHPIFTVDTQWGWTGQWDPDRSKSYAIACDIALWDEYPLMDTMASMPGRLFRVAETANRTLEVVHRESRAIPTMAVLQGYGMFNKARKENFPVGDVGRRRDPSVEELRYMTYTSLVHGSRGIIYWVYYRADSLVEARVRNVVHELHSLNVPDLILGPSKNDLISTSYDGLDTDGNGMQDLNYELREKDGLYYLVAVNDSPDTLHDVKLTFSSISSVRSVTAMEDDSEGRDRRLDAKQLTREGFRDGFSKFQVHLYRIEVDSSRKQ